MILDDRMRFINVTIFHRSNITSRLRVSARGRKDTRLRFIQRLIMHSLWRCS